MDDEEDNVRVLAQMLRWAGYDRLELTSDPFEGLRLFESHAPDLVLLDLHMPGLDGFGVMERLVPRVEAADWIPFLILTGDLDPEVRERGLSAGARDFITNAFRRGRGAPAHQEPAGDPPTASAPSCRRARGEGARADSSAGGDPGGDPPAARDGSRVSGRCHRGACGAGGCDGGADRRGNGSGGGTGGADPTGGTPPRRGQDRNSGRDPDKAWQPHSRGVRGHEIPYRDRDAHSRRGELPSAAHGLRDRALPTTSAGTEAATWDSERRRSR